MYTPPTITRALACSKTRSPPTTSRSPSRYFSGSTAWDKAPDFALQDFVSGKVFTLDSFRGKKVLLSFFRCVRRSVRMCKPHGLMEHILLGASVLRILALGLYVSPLAATVDGASLSRCRYAACPLCSYRLSQMIRRAEMLRNAGLQIVCVFETTHAQLKKSINKSNVPFPILMDPNSIVYNSYGVRSSLAESCISAYKQICIECSVLPVVCRGYGRCSTQHCSPKYVSRRPADFLIDERGIIVVAHHGGAGKAHLTWQSIHAFAGLNIGPLRRALPVGAPHVDMMSR
eukprot:scaffold55314_cov35-Tisochrysis_lutea.AAC.2